MFKIRPATRIAITLGMVCIALLCLTLSLSFVSHPSESLIQNRLSLTRNIAVSVTTLAEGNSIADINRFLERVAQTEPEITTLGLRRKDQLIAEGGDHQAEWKKSGGHLSDRWVTIEIQSSNRNWGQLEIVFADHSKSGLAAWLTFPIGLIGFLGASFTLSAWWVLSRTLRYLNPSKVVPDRVRTALDSISSGLVLTTPEGEIAFCNRSFVKMLKRPHHDIVGTKINDYEWIVSRDYGLEFPWEKTAKQRTAVTGSIVEARFQEGLTQKYMVNSTPLMGAENRMRGQLVSFEDVTVLEAKKTELAQTIQKVRRSRDEVERQNEKLFFLANYDSLTQCLNRRSFYTEFEKQWGQSSEHPLTMMILDIDHFKSVNDNHGHSVGDAVLKEFGEILRKLAGKQGTVCRYGGEEFIILLPNKDFEDCLALAEEIRSTVQQQTLAGLQITTSIGLSNRSLGAMDPQHLLDQADESLYAAKRSGRNQVVRFDQIERYKNLAEVEENANRTEQPTELLADNSFTAVSGLLSALSYRCKKTAEHSVRVADLVVEVGQSLLSKREICHLEIAALMHDVGKIGVPDSILNKPDRLTETEWEIMHRHQEIGVSILNSAVNNPEIVSIIRGYRSSKKEADPNRSISSKILEVCNAFDAMINEQVYRPKMSVAEAVEEIKKSTPEQFDPVASQKLIEFVTSDRFRYADEENSAEKPNPFCQNIVKGSVEGKCADRAADSTGDELERLTSLASEILELCDQSRLIDDSSEVAQTPAG